MSITREAPRTTMSGLQRCLLLGLLLAAALSIPRPASAQAVQNPVVWQTCTNDVFCTPLMTTQQAALDYWLARFTLYHSSGPCGALSTPQYRFCPIANGFGQSQGNVDVFALCPNGTGGYVFSADGYCPSWFVSADTPALTDCGDCDGVGENDVGEPLHPFTGNVSHTERDLEVSGAVGGLSFSRFYNSADNSTQPLGIGWRHTFSRRIAPRNPQLYQPYLISNPRYSSLFATPQDACTTGWPQVRASVSPLFAATGSYSNGICVLSQSGVPVTSAPIRTADSRVPPITIGGFDAIRDNGQIVTFELQGSALVATAGMTLRLTQTAGGFQLVDDQDNTETYDSAGRLQSVSSRAGIQQTVGYDANSRISTITDSFGNVITLGYDALGRLSTAVGPGSSTVQYGYDSQGRLATVTNPDLSARTYVYENSTFPNALTGLLNEYGLRLSTWEYDSTGRATRTYEGNHADEVSIVRNADGSATVTDALGAVRTFQYQRVGHRTRPVAITGSQCPTCRESAETTYDSAGFVSSRKDYNGNLTCYANDAQRGLELVRVEGFGPGSSCPSNLASYTTAANSRQRKISTSWHSVYREPTQIVEAGRTTSFTYDTVGNRLTLSVTDTATSAVRTWTHTYDGYGRSLTVDGPRTDVSDVTTYTYYACSSGFQCGHLHTVTDALGHTTTFVTYNAYGQPLTVMDANSVVTTLAYDARRRVTSAQVAGETFSFSYWKTGLLKRVTTPDGSYLQLNYDDAQRLTDVDDDEGNHVAYVLDANGNRTAEHAYDPSGALSRTRTQVFNSLGRLWKQVGAAATPAVTTTLGYDGNGSLTSTSAPLSRSTGNLFDELNRLQQISDPGSGVTTLAYSARDELTSVTDPRGLVTSYSYNGWGDLSQQVSPDTGTTTMTYDSGGNLKTRTDARSVTGTYNYDVLDRLTSIVYPDTTLSFTYDGGANGAGRLTGASDANHSLSRGYDALGRITGKSQTAGGVTRTVGYGYTDGHLTSVVTPSGQAVTYGYVHGRIASVAVNGNALLTEVLHEPFGPIRQWTWSNATASVRTFDSDGNLLQVDSGGDFYSYAYDDAFRVTGITNTSSAPLSWTYGYDSRDQLTSGSSPARNESWTYDANGNRVTQSATVPSTISNTLAISSSSNRVSSISGSHANTYGYDSTGNVTSESDAGRPVDGAGTTTYLFNALSQRIRKTSGGVSTFFVYDEGGHLLGEYTSSGALIQETVWLGDIPVATLRPKVGGGVDVYYVHTDHLNTPRKVTRPSDNVIMWRWDPAPFGDALPNENPESAGTFTYNLRFPGQYYDAESGLNYNYFRDFNSALGRYIESDPIGLRGGINTYAYALNVPTRRVDPRGLNPFQPSPLTQLEVAILEGNVEAVATISEVTGLSSAETGAAVARAGANANKIAHIFGQAKHKLDLLVKACGSEGKALQTLKEVGAKNFPANVNGVAKEFSVTIDGISVTIRGILVDGKFQLGTAFVP